MVNPDHFALINWKTLEEEITKKFYKANPPDSTGRTSFECINDQMEIARWYKLIRKHTVVEPPTEDPRQEMLDKLSTHN